MRVSTGMIFDAGVAAINKQTASLLHLQQQVSAGRRILTPADDPVAAARALEVTQSKDILAQYSTNQNNAKSALGLEEAQLTSVNDILGRLKELMVEGGNSHLAAGDRSAIAKELRARFDELVGIANATDGSGQYLFAGYMGDTRPFAGAADDLVANPASDVSYFGDDGQRRLQVSDSRQLEISDSGNDVFRRIRNGNGYFTTAYAAGNTGTGIIDAGAITDPATWNALTDKNYAINFTVDNSVTPAVTYYDIVDTVSGASILTGAAGPAPLANQRVYTPGQAIVLKNQGAEPAFDLGANVIVNGDPATGDSFSLAPSSSQSLFRTVANAIGALESNIASDADRAKLSNDVGFALTNLSQAENNILSVRAAIGSRLNEVDSLDSVRSDLDLQYQQTLSTLQDLDYAKAISDLTRKQTDLTAAQQSFARVSQLSLFNYL